MDTSNDRTYFDSFIILFSRLIRVPYYINGDFGNIPKELRDRDMEFFSMVNELAGAISSDTKRKTVLGEAIKEINTELLRIPNRNARDMYIIEIEEKIKEESKILKKINYDKIDTSALKKSEQVAAYHYIEDCTFLQKCFSTKLKGLKNFILKKTSGDEIKNYFAYFSKNKNAERDFMDAVLPKLKRDIPKNHISIAAVALILYKNGFYFKSNLGGKDRPFSRWVGIVSSLLNYADLKTNFKPSNKKLINKSNELKDKFPYLNNCTLL